MICISLVVQEFVAEDDYPHQKLLQLLPEAEASPRSQGEAQQVSHVDLPAVSRDTLQQPNAARARWAAEVAAVLLELLPAVFVRPKVQVELVEDCADRAQDKQDQHEDCLWRQVPPEPGNAPGDIFLLGFGQRLLPVPSRGSLLHEPLALSHVAQDLGLDDIARDLREVGAASAITNLAVGEALD